MNIFLLALVASNIITLYAINDGQLDTSFNTTGIVITPIAGGNSQVNSVLIQPNGQIVAIGSAQNGGAFAVARYNTDGSQDIGFGTIGVTVETFGATLNEAFAGALDAQGNIIVVGFSDLSGTQQLMVARFTPTGQLDTTFGSGTGFINPTIGTQSQANAVALDIQGRIVIGGFAIETTSQFLVARFTTTGIDTTFGTAGFTLTEVNPGSNDVARGLVIQANGSIVLAGQTDQPIVSIALARYLPTGELDSSFNGSGTVITTLGQAAVANALILRNNGKLVTVGGFGGATGTEGFLLVQYLSNGKLDTTFGNAGVSIAEFLGETTNYPQAGIVGKDNKIVAIGTIDDAGTANVGLARFIAQGLVDTTFGTAGVTRTAVTAVGPSQAFAGAFQANAYIVVGGLANNGTDNEFALARYTNTFSLPSQSVLTGAIINKYCA